MISANPLAAPPPPSTNVRVLASTSGGRKGRLKCSRNSVRLCHLAHHLRAWCRRTRCLGECGSSSWVGRRGRLWRVWKSIRPAALNGGRRARRQLPPAYALTSQSTQPNHWHNKRLVKHTGAAQRLVPAEGRCCSPLEHLGVVELVDPFEGRRPWSDGAVVNAITRAPCAEAAG